MKKLKTLILFVLCNHFLQAQEIDSTKVKKHKPKTELSFGVLMLKENVNKYWFNYQKFGPSFEYFHQEFNGYARDYSTNNGFEIPVCIALKFKKMGFGTGINYRRNNFEFYRDSFLYNKTSNLFTNNLKVTTLQNIVTIYGFTELTFYNSKETEFFLRAGLELGVYSVYSLKLVNENFYKYTQSKSTKLQGFESIAVGFKKRYKNISFSVPIVFETSFVNISYIKNYKHIYFYYKTGLIFSFN